MSADDTSLAQGPARFPETTWGLIARLRDPGRHRTAFEDLCRRYWRPVYRYARIAWGKTNEDAKDVAQAFFLWLLEGEALKRYAPERGGFRAYLKVLLRRFVGHQEAALQRLKRGGGATIVPLEDDAAVPDRPEGDPERAFDRAWNAALIEQALERVRRECDPAAFRVYEEYDLADPRPTYQELAARLGVGWNDVKNRLEEVREKVRSAVRRELAETTANAEELEEEWRALVGG